MNQLHDHDIDELLAIFEADGHVVARCADGRVSLAGGGPGETTATVNDGQLQLVHTIPLSGTGPLQRQAIEELLGRVIRAWPACQAEVQDDSVRITGQAPAALLEAEATLLLAAVRRAAARIQREVQALAASEELAAAYLTAIGKQCADTAGSGHGARTR